MKINKIIKNVVCISLLLISVSKSTMNIKADIDNSFTDMSSLKACLAANDNHNAYCRYEGNSPFEFTEDIDLGEFTNNIAFGDCDIIAGTHVISGVARISTDGMFKVNGASELSFDQLVCNNFIADSTVNLKGIVKLPDKYMFFGELAHYTDDDIFAENVECYSSDSYPELGVATISCISWYRIRISGTLAGILNIKGGAEVYNSSPNDISGVQISGKDQIIAPQDSLHLLCGFGPDPSPETTPESTPDTTPETVPDDSVDSFVVTFLDCNGETVSVQSVPYQGNAVPPAGYSYMGYTDISANVDLKPTGCVTGYAVPNTADRG
ncbi:MAG: hypothetical protein LKF79_07745 [Solobacterium sp.]|jgi:hypothetical protein|nr:hypothetical protein [Solobacterium sp.]MCH4223034.1 hypothetical protein [Solobacterium sp.]MCH4266519.1 hypothetical protein [Solobacterium sp.]